MSGETRYLIRQSRDKAWTFEIVENIVYDDGHSRIGEVVGHADKMRDAEKIVEEKSR